MISWTLVAPLVDEFGRHVLPLALISVRLVPVAFMCPLLGGTSAPMHVTLGVVLALSLFLHVEGGVSAELEDASLFAVAGTALRECIVGVCLGLVASLPFDSARMGGRFIDLFRGSSAEAALPLAGTREAATGDALYHLLVALAASAVAMPLTLAALSRSFWLVHVGAPVNSNALAMEVARLVGSAFSTGLAIGAPIAAMSLMVDALLGLASRATQGMSLQEAGTPLRILGGGAMAWLAIGVFAERLQAAAVGAPDAMIQLLELAQ